MNTLRTTLLCVCLVCAIAAPAFVPTPNPIPPPPTRHAGLERVADEATARIQAESRAELLARTGAPGRS